MERPFELDDRGSAFDDVAIPDVSAGAALSSQMPRLWTACGGSAVYGARDTGDGRFGGAGNGIVQGDDGKSRIALAKDASRDGQNDR